MALASLRCVADGLDNWTSETWSSANPGIGTIWDVAYANGTYVVAGDRTVATSTNGITWTANPATLATNLGNPYQSHLAVSSSGLFVLMGLHGDILSSPDGVSWSYHTQPITSTPVMYDVTWGNGEFVGVGTAGPNGGTAAIIASSDGINWTAPIPAGSGARPVLCVTYGNGLFVAAGEEISFVSTDGLNWTQGNDPSPGHTLTGIAYGNGLFAAVGDTGEIVVSSNGTNWFKQNSPTTIYFQGITYGNGLFVAVGQNGSIVTSPDGQNWTLHASSAPITTQFQTAKYANGKTFLGDDNGNLTTLAWPNDVYGVASAAGVSVAIGGQGLIAYSTDGLNWSQVPNFTSNSFRGVTAGIGSSGFEFVAVGDLGTVASSADGRNWSMGSSGITNPLYAVTGTANNLFVASGIGGTVLVSGNGSSWVSKNSGTNAPLRALAYKAAYPNTGLLVALGDSNILTSADDGTTWASQNNAGANSLTGAVYSPIDGLFVGVSGTSEILTSPDGKTWFQQNPQSGPLQGAAFGDDEFIAVGQSGGIITSTDGTNWQSHTSGTSSTLYGVAMRNNSFLAGGELGTIIASGPVLPFAAGTSGTQTTLNGVAVGNSVTTSNTVAVGASGTILSSSDGTNFSRVTSPTTNGIAAVIFGDGQYVAVGAFGAIATSADGKTWANSSSGTGNALTGIAYGAGAYVAVGAKGTILTSTNGVSWTTVAGTRTLNIMGVSFGNGLFAALNSDGTVLTSQNGKSWTVNSPPLLTPLVSVAFANGFFLGTDAYGEIYSSSDGINWTPDFGLPSSAYTSIAYANGQLVAVGANGSIISTPLALGPTVPDVPLRAIAYGNGLYVAAGDNGTIVTSSDGATWTVPAGYVPTVNDLLGVAYGNGTFAVVGDNGWTVTSSDGVNWLSTSTGVVNRLQGVTFADNQFVAVGKGGTFLVSPDGTNWTLAGAEAGTSDTTDNLNAITHGGTQFVAVGDDAAVSFTSPTGISWTQEGTGLNNDYDTSVTYGNGVFVATSGSEIYTSVDGSTWTEQAYTGVQLNGVAYGGGLYVAVGNDGVIFSSPDGANWTAVPSITDVELNGITYDGNAFYIVGEDGNIFSAVPKALAAPTGIAFTEASYSSTATDTNNDITGFIYGGGQFVAVGNDSGVSFSSPNAQQWAEGGTGLNDDYYTGVTYGNGTYVAVDTSGDLYSSTDGSTWTEVAEPGTTLNAVAFGNGTFVAFGSHGVVETSSNGKQWVARQPATANELFGIIFDGTQFVAVGDNGAILTSANGITWASGGSGVTSKLYGITYGGGRYVAVGDSGTIATSASIGPASVWIQPSNYVGTPNRLNAVAWGGNQFVAVGNQGWMATSPDGLNWTSRNSPTVESLNAIVFADSEFVMGGDGGIILTASINGPPQINTQPSSQTVAAGQTVQLQVAASGTGTLSYKWDLNGNPVNGGTTSTLTLPSIGAGNSGSYTVIVGNSYGSVTSAVAVVTVGVGPSITHAPANQLNIPPGGVASFTVTATGNPPPTYRWFNGSTLLSDGNGITGSTTSNLVINPVATTDAGTYSVVVSNSFGTAQSTHILLTTKTETTKPTVTITVPPVANFRTNGPTLSGTASDVVQVKAVNYWITNVMNHVVTVFSGQATLIGGSGTTSNWVINTSPAGSNTLVVQSVNYANLMSPLLTRAYFLNAPAPFGLLIYPGGSGTVTGTSSIARTTVPSTGSPMLFLGQGYSVTGKPAAGWLFENWTSNGVVLTTNSTLSFIMTTNLTLHANFTTNIYREMAGRYDGLFSVPNVDPTEGQAGMIGNFIVKTNGIYSGTLYLAGATYSLSGSFNPVGQVVETVSRTAALGNPVTLTLNWIPGVGIPQITGTVQGNASSIVGIKLP